MKLRIMFSFFEIMEKFQYDFWYPCKKWNTELDGLLTQNDMFKVPLSGPMIRVSH